MLLQTHKTFVHLRDTNEDIFKEIREVSEPPIGNKFIATFKAQKARKDIFKKDHVTTVVQP